MVELDLRSKQASHIVAFGESVRGVSSPNENFENMDTIWCFLVLSEAILKCFIFSKQDFFFSLQHYIFYLNIMRKNEWRIFLK